ncbi:hypothetical protein [Streptomyces sp. PsTaAH-124]|uniref:hypothetical protein n=1 Tax=Streptomyces sp. PsTaAH-124 TaxID=1157638 RepID=UPI00037D992C|nr:hypothetical protein [Streptomyces sp. PsTaAH-124]
MSDHLLRLLRDSPRLAELAAFPFEFDLAGAEHVEEVRLADGGPLEPVAGDGSGGTYFVCGDGSVLYADSEGSAGIIGPDVDTALEVLVGLPGWQDLLDLTPADGAEVILARVAETEDERREDHGIDEERAALRSALGLPERSPVELVALLHEALLRTEPGFLLLNAEEGCAYQLLDPLPRPTLREVVLAHAPDTGALVTAGPEEDGASLFTWAGHALDLGLTEHARAALIRALDEIVMNRGALRRPGAPGELGLSSLVRLAEAFDRLGDHTQALRARQLHTALDRPAVTTAAGTTATGTGRR